MGTLTTSGRGCGETTDNAVTPPSSLHRLGAERRIVEALSSSEPRIIVVYGYVVLTASAPRRIVGALAASGRRIVVTTCHVPTSCPRPRTARRLLVALTASLRHSTALVDQPRRRARRNGGER